MSRAKQSDTASVSDRVRLRPRTIYLLNQANQAVRGRLEAELREIGLTGIQYTVLAIVGGRQEVSSAELSRRFFVTPQTMNEIVAGLEKRGLMERHPSEANKRVLTAQLTAAGRQALASADTIADAVEGAALANLREEDFRELRRLLSLLLGDMRNNGQASPAGAKENRQ